MPAITVDNLLAPVRAPSSVSQPRHSTPQACPSTRSPTSASASLSTTSPGGLLLERARAAGELGPAASRIQAATAVNDIEDEVVRAVRNSGSTRRLSPGGRPGRPQSPSLGRIGVTTPAAAAVRSTQRGIPVVVVDLLDRLDVSFEHKGVCLVMDDQ